MRDSHLEEVQNALRSLKRKMSSQQQHRQVDQEDNEFLPSSNQYLAEENQHPSRTQNGTASSQGGAKKMGSQYEISQPTTHSGNSQSNYRKVFKPVNDCDNKEQDSYLNRQANIDAGFGGVGSNGGYGSNTQYLKQQSFNQQNDNYQYESDFTTKPSTSNTITGTSNYTGRSHKLSNQTSNYNDDANNLSNTQKSTYNNNNNNGQSRQQYQYKSSNGIGGFEDENEFYDGTGNNNNNNRRHQSNMGADKRNSNQYGSKIEREYENTNMVHRKECEDDEYTKAMKNYQNIKGNYEKPSTALPPKSYGTKSPLTKTPSVNNNPNYLNEFEGDYQNNQKSTLDPYLNSGARPNLSQTADYSRPKTISDHASSNHNFPEKKQYSVQKYYKNTTTANNEDSHYSQQQEQIGWQNGRSHFDENDEHQPQQQQQFGSRKRGESSTQGSFGKDDFAQKPQQSTDMKSRGIVSRSRGNSAFEEAPTAEESGKDQQNTRMMKRFQKVEEGLQVCTEGCGRTFNEFALERHVKICRKVFQEKRKVFDVTQTRAPQQASEQVKQTNEEMRQEIVRKRNENHECPDCGRTFRFEVFEKHVKICLRVFPKKNRENSLIRKASQSNQGEPSSLGQTAKLSGTTRLPPSSAQSGPGASNNKQSGKPETTEGSKKPPLKKQGEETRRSSAVSNGWDETPIGGGGNTANAWDDIPVGAGAKRSSSHTNWDSASEYPPPSQTGSKMTAASTDWGDQDGLSPLNKKPPTITSSKQQQQQRNQRKPSWNDDYSTTPQEEPPRPPAKPVAQKLQAQQSQKQKPAWNDDWNDEQQAASKTDSPQKKNYNFNKQVKTLKSTNQSFDRNMDTNNDIYEDDDYTNHPNQTNNNHAGDKYVYSKPNIGKKVINSAKKQTPIESSPKQQVQRDRVGNPVRASGNYNEPEENQVEEGRWGRQPAKKQQQQQQQQPKNKYEEEEQEQAPTTAQYSKPFLKKNQGNQSMNVRKGGAPTAPVTAAERQSMEGGGGFNHTPFEDPTDLPIKKNTDFNRQMMELEMKVQQSQKQEQNYSQQNNRFNPPRGGYDDDNDEYGGEQAAVQLIECPEGCGRKFAEAALEKHTRICKKVFQQKRKAYNSAAHRVTDEQIKDQLVPVAAIKQAGAAQPRKVQPSKQQSDDNSYMNRPNQYQQSQQSQKQQSYQDPRQQQQGAQRGLPPAASKGGKQPPSNPFDKKSESENTKVGKKMPSWKIQSEAFRAVMRNSKGDNQTSEYDQAIIKEAFQRDDYVQCNFCQRRFNTKAAERHIPFCKTKSETDKFKTGGKATTNLNKPSSSAMNKTATRRQY